jgi:hypothetical protein
MNRLPDVEPVLRAYLADTGDRAPDRVLEDVAARIARQPRRPWRLRGRPFMNLYAKLGAAAAAVVLVAIVGYTVLPRAGGAGGQASPNPTLAPTPSPSAAPSASSALPSGYPISGLLPAGNHTTKTFTPRFTFTTPEGWINDGDESTFYSLFPDTVANRAEFARTGDPAQGIVVASDRPRPWLLCEAWEDNRGATAAAMVAAVMANPALATTGVTDVTIGGLTGKQFDVGLNPAWTQTCPGDPPGTDLSQVRSRAVFLDRPGSLVLVIFEPQDVAEAQAIVESIAFAR